jgi:hypothetical protein
MSKLVWTVGNATEVIRMAFINRSLFIFQSPSQLGIIKGKRGQHRNSFGEVSK